MFEMQDARVNGVLLRVRVGGAAGDAPIVLFHGVTRSGIDWLPLFGELQCVGRVHAVDQRGHGGASKGLGAYRLTDYIHDACGYVESLDAPALVIGHSLGAMVAAGVASERPECVRGVVLEDPTYEMTGRRMGETFFVELFQAFLPHAGSERSAAEIARALAAVMIGAPGGPRLPLGTTRDAASLRYHATSLKALDPDVLKEILEGRLLEGYDVEAALRGIACPTLFLHGDFAAGGALPEEYAESLARLIPDVCRVRLARVGHNIHGMAREAMLRPLLAFIGSLG